MGKYIVSPWGPPPEPLPEVVVLFHPKDPLLGIQAGSPVRISESETIANNIVAHYNHENSLVALDVDGAERALEPLINAARRPARYKRNSAISKRSACFLDTPNSWIGSMEDVVVFYTPETQALRIQAGDPVSVHQSEAVARGMTAHYDADGSLVAVDLQDAEALLKPFLDAVRSREKEKAAQASD